MKKFLAALLLMLATVAASTVSTQQAGFASRVGAATRESNGAAARELYATARYDEALALLNSLRSADSTDPSRTQPSSSTVALAAGPGRDLEAENAIAAAVTADPFFAPTEAEASPRVRTKFSDVRSKLLPGIATARYAVAKQAFDKKDHANAERQFGNC